MLIKNRVMAIILFSCAMAVMNNLHAQSARERDLRLREEKAANKEADAKRLVDKVRAMEQAATLREKELEAAKAITAQAQRERDEALKKAAPTPNQVRVVGDRRIPKEDRDNLSSGGHGPEMILIPAGSYWMGAKAGEVGAYEDEKLQHEVTISKPFYAGKYEVTRGQFAQFVQQTRYQSEAEKGQGCASFDAEKKQYTYKSELNWRTPGFEQADTHPVVCVSWNDAQAYLGWLNKESGGKGYRLLSEGEWEYAARAEQRGKKESKRFSWGDDSDYKEMCAYANGRDTSLDRVQPGFAKSACDDGYLNTAPVGKKLDNAFGLFDMHGNATEWVEDCWHSEYKNAPLDGSAWSEACTDETKRVLRGGSWNLSPRVLRSAFRFNFSSDDRNNIIGFRVARTAP